MVIAFQIPFSTTIFESEVISQLSFPVVAKPKEGYNHQHVFVANRTQLDKLLGEGKCPEFLQEFVHHDGIVHKVYVVGDLIGIIQRASIQLDKFAKKQKPRKFRTAAVSGYKKRLKLRTKYGLDPEIVYEMVSKIRNATNMTLFGIDIVIEEETEKHYLFDINYMPGFVGEETAPTVLHNLLVKLRERTFARAASKKK